ncbi:MAG: hypothetical protein J6X22_08685 [Muribaculaceae bacterium]|nr:hypothetical protein [Muribaculaceae bacterium]
MNDDKYLRSIDDLEKIGCKWWPKEVRDEAMKVSILQYLLDTQEKFISLLTLADSNKQEKLFNLLDASDFEYHLFLKHIILLTDVGSEPIQRINTSFKDIFPNSKMLYKLGRKEHVYTFTSLPIKGKLDNKKMKIDTTENLQAECRNKNLCKDLINLLIYGAASTTPRTRAILYKCNAFEYLGKEDKIKQYVRENYIRVSRIIAGKTATDLGNVAQVYALNYLSKGLGDNYNLVNNGTIPGVKLDDEKDATFDIVVDRKNDKGRFKKYVGIEVSFQETSNSVAERKGREAQARFRNTNNKRCYVAYIIDGVGNFSRPAAMNDMCNNSHCNVAYTSSEFDLLIDFIKEKIG